MGTPQKLISQSGSVVWSAKAEAFGGATVDSASSITNNLRFPGQYFDTETGFHQSYFRDYDPMTGRYVESDPIGLRGGINTYNYALNNPLLFTDETGLDVWRCKRPLDGKPGDGPVLFLPELFRRYHEYLCATDEKGRTRCGSTTPTTKTHYTGTPARASTEDDDDKFHVLACEPVDKGNEYRPNCVEECVIGSIEREWRPEFAVGPLGTDCQEWSEDTLESCIKNICSQEANARAEMYSRQHRDWIRDLLRQNMRQNKGYYYAPPAK